MVRQERSCLPACPPRVVLLNISHYATKLHLHTVQRPAGVKPTRASPGVACLAPACVLALKKMLSSSSLSPVCIPCCHPSASNGKGLCWIARRTCPRPSSSQLRGRAKDAGHPGSQCLSYLFGHTPLFKQGQPAGSKGVSLKQ